MPILSKLQLEELKEFDTPTISNAIEMFNIRPRTEGFMGPEIKCILPYKKPLIGYAATAIISSIRPPAPLQKEMLYEAYDHVKKTQSPTFFVIQDIDPAPVGSFWGEVQTNTVSALGCVGTITNGGVRDLDEVNELGFGYFASCVVVSHAYIHIENCNCPVKIGGLTINPGDLLHADKHGVILIPDAIVHKLADACRKVQLAEKPFIEACRKKFAMGIEVEEIRKLREQMVKKREEN